MRTLLTVLALVSLTAAFTRAAATPPKADVDLAQAEIKASYAKASPEVQEWILHTARTFGQSGMWVNENAFATLKPEEREERIVYLAKLFNEANYGRQLCMALSEAGGYKDPRLVAPLMKVAGYEKEGEDYDCRPKWMAIAALARQESPDAVPLLISLTDFGNENCRLWARAALARMAKDDFKADKQAWNKWWIAQGHESIDAKYLKPTTPPPKETPKQ